MVTPSLGSRYEDMETALLRLLTGAGAAALPAEESPPLALAGAYWREPLAAGDSAWGAPLRVIARRASAGAGAATSSDAVLDDAIPPPASGIVSLTPPDAVMRHDASSANNERLELCLRNNDVATAQRLLIADGSSPVARGRAKGGAGGTFASVSSSSSSSSSSSAAQRSSSNSAVQRSKLCGGPGASVTLKSLLQEPLFKQACEQVGLAPALIAPQLYTKRSVRSRSAAATSASSRELLKHLALALTQFRKDAAAPRRDGGAGGDVPLKR